MYEENGRIDWMNLIIKAIIFFIIILFITWLLSLSTKNLSKSLDVVNENIVAENMTRIEEAGKSYFTTERLPEKVGETKKITLKEMYDKHLILEVKDSEGKSCDLEKSYVEVSKLDNEYEMKTYLKCGKDSKYVITKMGCYNYCPNAICEYKKPAESKSSSSKSVVKSSSKSTAKSSSKKSSSSKPSSSKPSSSSKITVTEYEYKLTTAGYWTEYGAWSDWSLTSVSATNERQTQSKVVTETYYVTETVEKNVDVAFSQKCSVGSMVNGKCQKAITTTTTSTPICPSKSGYSVTRNGFTCTYTKTSTNNPTCASTYNGYTLTSQNGLTCNYSKTTTSSSQSFVKQTTGSYLPGDTSTYHYEKVSVKDVLSCESTCKKQTIYTYNVYEKKTTTNTLTTTTTLSCPAGTTLSGTNCIVTDTITASASCPTGYDKVNGTCSKTVTSYVYSDPSKYCPAGTHTKADGTGCYKTVTETVSVPKTKSTTYYRYRVRSYVEGTTQIKWSSSKNDKKLLSLGYKLTGKTRTYTK